MNHPETGGILSSSGILDSLRSAFVRALPLLPLAILGVAFLLRISGTDWDQGALYHPDERSIFMRSEQMHRTLTSDPGWQFSANMDFPLDKSGIPSVSTFFDSEKSPLNPHWFPLGSIIIYLLVGIRYCLDIFTDQVKIQD